MKDGKKYILIADDEKEIRDVLTLLLSGEGYAVVGTFVLERVKAETTRPSSLHV